MTYSISLERGDLNYAELAPLYMQHYGEMQKRLLADGIPIGNYKPNLTKYFEAFAGGWLLNYVVRKDGLAIGYSNVYLTNDMHNGELIAREDTIYMLPEHRNGMGKKLVKHILADLTARGVKRAAVTAVTDTRVAKVWKRMGFKETASMLTFVFEGN